MIRVRYGWRDNLFYNDLDEALQYVKSLMQSMNAVKPIDLELQVVDRAEWEWEHVLTPVEKAEYVSINHYKRKCKKGVRQYEIESQYEEEKAAYNKSKKDEDNEFPYFGAWLERKGLKQEYEYLPITPPVETPEDVDPNLEIVHDYREGNML